VWAERGRRAVLGLSALLVGAAIGPERADAQISPGPLSAAHEELEGMKNCLKCHGLGESDVDPHCLDCHGEIARLRADGRGFHARDASGACADCHLEHGGRDFELVDWGRGGAEGFDHARTGWALDGKHVEAKCEACHKAELRVSPVASLREGGLGERSWLGLETDCASCHRDPHEGRFGAACADCHVTTDFHTIVESSFDHARTRFPLRGAHARVECARCHVNGYEDLPRFDECRACHDDPHGGRAVVAGARPDCAECHGVSAFSPSTFDGKRHAETRYPLEGRHARVTCRDCHGGGVTARDGAGRAVEAAFRFRPAHAACTDCHEDAHAGQLASRGDGGRCDACHDVQGFRPARYGVTEHAALAFPLEGAHATAECGACHGPRRPGLPGLPGREVTGSAGVLLRLGSTACVECHVDPHRGRLGREDVACRSCHGTGSFRPAAVDAARHAEWEFPLVGAHAAVPCFACHRDLEAERPASTLRGSVDAWPALEMRAPGSKCADCHDDPHGGQFAGAAGGRGTDCATCHDADTFRPATAFDHDRDARFPLAGSHARVACAGCHPESARPDGTVGPKYRPLSFACEDCHATPVGENP
jgi:hypothetical protein